MVRGAGLLLGETGRGRMTPRLVDTPGTGVELGVMGEDTVDVTAALLIASLTLSLAFAAPPVLESVKSFEIGAFRALGADLSPTTLETALKGTGKTEAILDFDVVGDPFDGVLGVDESGNFADVVASTTFCLLDPGFGKTGVGIPAGEGGREMLLRDVSTAMETSISDVAVPWSASGTPFEPGERLVLPLLMPNAGSKICDTTGWDCFDSVGGPTED